MTAGQQMMLGSGGRQVSFNITSLQGLSIAPTPATATVTFNSTGFITYNGSPPVGVGQPTAWTLPTGAATEVGANYWIRMQCTGVAPNSGPLNTLQRLDVSRAWQWQASSGQGNRHSDATVQFYSDAAGTNLVFSDTFPVDVESQL